MIPLTCADVQDQLDLLAAGACDPAVRLEIERHLSACPQCAAQYALSQRLRGLLDLHWNEAALERLQRRIEHQGRPQRRRLFVTSFVRGYVAAAAVLLLAVGLMWWNTQDTATGPQLALLVHAGRHVLERDAQMPTRAVGKGVEALAPARKLATPAAVDLDLTLVNNGLRPVVIRIGEAAPTLSLDVEGNAVVRLPAPAAPTPPFLEPQALRLEPGQRHVIHIVRLVAGAPGALEYIHLTEPGEYVVTARLRLLVDGKVVTVTGGPVRLAVRGR